MIEKENAVQVVHLMTEGAGQQVFSFDSDFLAVQVEPPQYDTLWPDHGRGKPRNTQTSFVFELFSVDGDDLWIDNGDQFIAPFTAAGIRNHDSLGNTDLVGRQSDARSLVHGFHHVIDE